MIMHTARNDSSLLARAVHRTRLRQTQPERPEPVVPPAPRGWRLTAASATLARASSSMLSVLGIVVIIVDDAEQCGRMGQQLGRALVVGVVLTRRGLEPFHQF